MRLSPAGADIDAAILARVAAPLRGDKRVIERPGPDQDITLADAGHGLKKDPAQQLKIEGPPCRPGLDASGGRTVTRTAGGYLAAHDRWVSNAMDLGARTVFERQGL